MSRAVLLPSIGDPFALKFWLYCFEKWGKNVDKVYVSIGPRDGKYQEVIDYSKELLKDFQFVGIGDEMNTAFNDLLMNPMPEETFLLIQDDAYIFDSGIVDACFRSIEEGWTDIVASNQFTYPAWLNEYITELYPDEEKQANRGLAFYPNFFFGRVADIQNTKLGIGVQQLRKNTPIDFLDNIVLPETADMDLMGALSLELRHKGLRWQYVPQYQDGYWEQWKDKKIPWTHVTGLSAIWNGIQSGVSKESNAYPHNIMLQRLTWHVLFYEMFEMTEIQWFVDEYKNTIDEIMKISGVTREELEPRIKYFKSLL